MDRRGPMPAVRFPVAVKSLLAVLRCKPHDDCDDRDQPDHAHGICVIPFILWPIAFDRLARLRHHGGGHGRCIQQARRKRLELRRPAVFQRKHFQWRREIIRFLLLRQIGFPSQRTFPKGLRIMDEPDVPDAIACATEVDFCGAVMC